MFTTFGRRNEGHDEGEHFGKFSKQAKACGFDVAFPQVSFFNLRNVFIEPEKAAGGDGEGEIHPPTPL